MNTIIRGLLYSLVVLAFIDGSPAVFSSVAQSAPASGAAGAVSRQPPRDAARPVATARILGRVVAADTGQPLRKAQVRIAANDAKVNRTTTTDAQGRYEFKELPAGRYTVAATKGSFVTAIYGQRRPFEPGKPVDVSAGQAFDKIDLALSRGAVITGQVVDEFGSRFRTSKSFRCEVNTCVAVGSSHPPDERRSQTTSENSVPSAWLPASIT